MHLSTLTTTATVAPTVGWGIFAVLALIYLPAALMLWCTPIKRVYILLVAPGLALGLIALTSIVTIVSDIAWGIKTYLLVSILFIAATFLARYLIYRLSGLRFKGHLPRHLSPRSYRELHLPPWQRHTQEPLELAHQLWFVAGLIAAMLLTFYSFSHAFGGNWGLPSQTIDASIHYANTQGMLTMGTGSPLDTTSRLTLGATRDTNFYPSLASNLAALIAPIYANNVVMAHNVAAWLLAGLIIPSGLTLITTVILPRHRILKFAVPMLATALWGASWLPATAGVLWPTLIGTASVAFVCAATIGLIRGYRQLLGAHKALLITCIIVGICISALSHPRAALISGIMATLMIWMALCQYFLRRLPKAWARGTLMLVAFLIYLAPLFASGAALFGTQRNRSTYIQPVISTPWTSIVNQLSGGTPVTTLTPWIIAILMWVGLAYACANRSLRIWVFIYVLFAGLQVLIESVRTPITDSFIGLWYGDSFRSIFGVSFTSMILASFGLVATGLYVSQFFNSAVVPRLNLGKGIRATRFGGSLLAFTLVFATTGGLYAQAHGEYLSTSYRATFSPALNVNATPSEINFYSTLRQYVPAGQVVINDPGDGTSFAYISGGVLVTSPSLTGFSVAVPRRVFANAVRVSFTPETSCKYLLKQSLRFVLINDRKFYQRTTYGQSFGLRVDPNGPAPEGWTIIAQSGSIKLYKLSICDQFAALYPPDQRAR